VKHRIRAFTLIELLVVIAIVALLLSILIPSLGKAKEKVKSTICKTHLRGLGQAITLYLEAYDGRAYYSANSNGFQWYNASGHYLNPDDGAAYWGVAYKDYAEDPDVFGCPSYAKVAELLYGADPDLAKQAGFALNQYFFRDPRAATGDPNRHNRKIAGMESPYQFIICQDHVEPRIEGNSGSGASDSEQDDMMYIPSGQRINLRHYRATAAGGRGERQDFYWGIFRHSKRNRALDQPAYAAERITQIDKNPNGQSNTLFLDTHVEGVPETTGYNIPWRWYSGYRN